MKSRKRGLWKSHAMRVMVVFSLLLLLIFLISLYTSGIAPFMRGRTNEAGVWPMRLMIATIQFLTVTWFFFFGASVGSFLNVVVCRMPLGESIVMRPSHCPYCNVNIRARDNIPVLGWLLLAGRCRVCHLPISVRYPIVESLTGVMLTSLAYVELLSGGANLPHVIPPPAAGLTWTVVDIKPGPLTIYVYHSILLAVLLSSALIKLDKRAIPLKVLLFGLAIGVGIPAFGADVHPVSWVSLYPLARLSINIGRPWDDMLIGLVIGGTIGLLVTSAVPRRSIAWSSISPRPEVAPLSALVGVMLGWQAVLACMLLTVLLKLCEAVVASFSREIQRLPLVAYLTIAVYIQFCLWSITSEWRWWPGPQSSWRAVLATAAVCLVAIAATALLRPQLPTDADSALRDEPV